MKASYGNELSFSGFSGRISPAWDSPALRSALADFRGLAADPRAKVLLDSRNVVTSVHVPLGSGGETKAVLKSYGARGLNRIRTRFSASKAVKAWAGAVALVERGIPTAEPIAYWEWRRRGAVSESCFLSAFIPEAREVRFLLREFSGEALDSLLRDLAVFLLTCHERGVVHKDLSDGNILVGPGPSGGRAFYLLDTNRVRVRSKVGGLARMKNLVRLGVPAGRREFFLSAYASTPPLPKRLRWWYKFQKAVYAGRVEFKKKLRLKRLARKLGLQ